MSSNGELLQLMRPYAMKGVEDWREAYRISERDEIQKTLGARIAGTEWEAHATVNGRKEGGVEFIPMPKLNVKKVEWGFFSPRLRFENSADGWVFDLFLLLPERKHIGFRFEPADGFPNGQHEFSHIQLCWQFGHKSVQPEYPLTWLPDSYPAFPIPGRASLDRFLMLLVSMHGFPGGLNSLLDEVNPGRRSFGRSYSERLGELLI